MGKNEEQEIKKLNAKVKELELTVVSQQKLIEIFKSIPGYEGAITDDASRGVSKRSKNRGGAVAKISPKGKPKDCGQSAGGKHANGQIVEEKN